ncbi:MAG TPA: hypothetical protein VL242_42380 [Sorangium sp.]|nr:hypothetical protein [Sorangium sp.]
MMLSLLVGCGRPPPVAAPGVPPGGTAVVLKAALFPYIPDSVGDNFASLIRTLESGFEAMQPGVDLQITIDPNMDLYDYAPGGTLNTLLGNGAGAMSVVEVDTLLMGTLVSAGWVQPSGMSNPGVFTSAWEAASVGGTAYGMPTYLCTNVIYSTDSAISAAQNGTNLLGILSGIKPGVPALVGNYEGSWTLPGTYVDAWADTNGASNMSASFALPLDQKTMAFFSPVVSSCASSTTTNPCLDGTYGSGAGTGAELAFASGNANGFIGYTERLFYIRQAAPSAPLPSVISDPIGGGSNPSMFVDALVFNRSCVGACLHAAQAYAAYMSSVSVRNIIAFSQDGPQGTLPRYLLQANQSFYSSAPASTDPMYKQYASIVNRATPYPNTGFPNVRKELNAALIAALKNPPPPARKVSTTAAPTPQDNRPERGPQATTH